MRTLHHKLVHDLSDHRAQYLAIALVIAIGVAAQVASGGLLASLQSARDSFYIERRFADLFAPLKRAPDAAIAGITALPGVHEAQPRIRSAGIISDPRLPEPGSVQLVSWPGDGLNAVALQEGRPPAPDSEELVISSAFATAWRLHAGDRLRMIVNGRMIDPVIVGTGDSPEFVYSIAPGGLLPDYRRHTVAWMDHGKLAALAGLQGGFNDLTVTLEPNASAGDVIAALDRRLAAFGATGAYGRDQQLSDRFIENEFDELEVHTTVVPFIFLGSAAFLLHLVLTRRVRRERETIGMLKAFGYGNPAIGIHYLLLGMTVYLIGAAAGIVLGIWLGRLLAGLYVDFFRFPAFHFAVDAGRTALGLLVAGAAVASGTLAGLAEAIRLPPAEAMRPPAPPLYRRSLSLPPAVRQRLGLAERMIVRHLAHGPVRTMLTVAGLAIACALVTFSGFQRNAIDYMTDFHFELQDRSDLSLTFIEPTAGRAIQDLLREPGVTAVEPFRNVAVTLRHGHASYRCALESWPQGSRLRRLLDRNRETIALPASGVLMSAQLAGMLGLRPGDRVQVEVMDGERQRFELPLAGLLDDYVGVGAYLRIEQLHRLLQEQDAVSGALLAVEPAARTDVQARLAMLPRVAGVSRRDAQIESFNETFGQSLLIVAFVFLLIAGSLAFAMVFNAARTVFDERRRELATMRVLGMGLAETAYILLAELTVLTLLAVPAGMALGYGLAAMLAQAMQSELFRLPVILEAGSYARATMTLFGAAALSMAWSAWDLARLDVKEALAARD
jgi:putative ABC transport system permease protein